MVTLDICTEVLARDDARLSAMRAADIATFDTLLWDQLDYIHSNGLRDGKDSYLAILRNGALAYVRIEARERRAIALAPAVVLVRGQQSMDLVLHGVDKTIHALFNAIWRSEPDGWRLP